MNVYQAALSLRDRYENVEGFMTEAMKDKAINAYFIYHDALHSLLGLAPEEEFEPQVLATELVLGGLDHSFPSVTPEMISNGLASIDAANLEDLIAFYSAWFNK
jgi:hypothetical protein